MALPDIDALASYIAAPQLVDFSGVVDPNTDMAAAGANQALCSLAMGTRMFSRAAVAFTVTANAVTFHDAVWGNDSSVKPNVSKAGTGLYSIAWPSTVSDQLGVEHSVNFRAVLVAQVQSASTFFLITPTLVSATGVSLRIGNIAGTLTDPAGADRIFVALL